jgi:adenylyltransferase/sulfurtransferase
MSWTDDNSTCINERYARQVVLGEIGESGQRMLGNAKVLIVGVGGLGSVSSLYLAGAGVGTIGLVDADVVSLSNLQRQILYDESEIGLKKVFCAARRLKAINGNACINSYPVWLTEENADEIIDGYDIVVDGCDNFAARFVMSDVCRKKNKPYIYGAISDFTGQVSVLCLNGGRTLRDIYSDEDLAQTVFPKGVVGMTPGIVGSVQALQAVKYICGFGETLVNKLWIIDLKSMESDVISV